MEATKKTVSQNGCLIIYKLVEKAGSEESEQPGPDIGKSFRTGGMIRKTYMQEWGRKDYLISSHLANMNCNETLVMQMVLRDLRYGTNHHRYGYAEEPEYINDLGKAPYRTGDRIFGRIADHLYAAALTYDRLAKEFYPHYQNRSDIFFAIWDCYEALRRSVR